MFEVGFSELLLIMGLALLVLGPEKLPKVVSEIGRWMGRARAMARQFREQLEDEAAETQRRRHEPVATEATGRDEPSTAEHGSAASAPLMSAAEGSASAAFAAAEPPPTDQTPADQTPADQFSADQAPTEPPPQDARSKE